MDEPKRRLVADWLQKASNDICSAERLMQPAPILDTALYHCQQAVEKALKGYLASNDVPVQKTHDLTVLVDRCMDFDRRFAALVELCEVLTPYGTEFRCPGGDSPPQAEDASTALIMQRMPWYWYSESLTTPANCSSCKSGSEFIPSDQWAVRNAKGALSGLNTALYGQQSNRGVAMRREERAIDKGQLNGDPCIRNG